MLDLTEKAWMRLLVVAAPDPSLVRMALNELPLHLDAAADASLADRLSSAEGDTERVYAEFAYRWSRLVPHVSFADDEASAMPPSFSSTAHEPLKIALLCWADLDLINVTQVARVRLAHFVAGLRSGGRRASNILPMLDFGHTRKNGVKGAFGFNMPLAELLAAAAGVKAGAQRKRLLATCSKIEPSVRFSHAACYSGLVDRAAAFLLEGKLDAEELAALQAGYAAHHAEAGARDERRRVVAIDGLLDLHRVAVDDDVERIAAFKFRAWIEEEAKANLGVKALHEFMMDMLPMMVLQAVSRTRPENPRWRMADYEHGCQRCAGPICRCLSQFPFSGCFKTLILRWNARPGHRYQSTMPQQVAALLALLGHVDPYIVRGCAQIIGEAATGISAWARGNGCGWEPSMLQEMLAVLVAKRERGLDAPIALAEMRVIAASMRDDALREERAQQRVDVGEVEKRRELSHERYELLQLRQRALRRAWRELHASARREGPEGLRVPGHTALYLRKAVVLGRLLEAKMESHRTAEALASDPTFAFLMHPTRRLNPAPSSMAVSAKSKMAGTTDAPVKAAQRDAHLNRQIEARADVSVPRPKMEHDVMGGGFDKVQALDTMIVQVQRAVLLSPPPPPPQRWLTLDVHPPLPAQRGCRRRRAHRNAKGAARNAR